MKFDIGLVLDNVSRQFKSHYNIKTNVGILHEDLCALLLISGWILLLWEMFKQYFEKTETNFVLKNISRILLIKKPYEKPYQKRTGHRHNIIWRW